MQRQSKSSSFRPAPLLAAALAAMLTLVLPSAALAQSSSLVYANGQKPFGKTYAQWSAAWWQWALALPVAHHPFDSSNHSCNTDDQSGSVWFLASSSPPGERSCTIPAGTALFLGLTNVDCSSLERPIFKEVPLNFGFGAPDEEAQRRCATFYGDHILPDSLICTIDGQEVANLSAFRFVSSQFEFTAPRNWIFAPNGQPRGGSGTAVADGYFLMIKPLSAGEHTLNCGGKLFFSETETGGDSLTLQFGNTYTLTVQ